MDTETVSARLFLAVDLIMDSVKNSGPTGIPSGHLYAMLMAYGMTLPVYEMLIDALTRNHLITVEHHVLRAV